MSMADAGEGGGEGGMRVGMWEEDRKEEEWGERVTIFDELL